MTIAAVKEKLHEYIDYADVKKLKAMYALLEDEIIPDYDADNEELQASIERGIKELENGMGIPHKVVMAELRKRYGL